MRLEAAMHASIQKRIRRKEFTEPVQKKTPLQRRLARYAGQAVSNTTRITATVVDMVVMYCNWGKRHAASCFLQPPPLGADLLFPLALKPALERVFAIFGYFRRC